MTSITVFLGGGGGGWGWGVGVGGGEGVWRGDITMVLHTKHFVNFHEGSLDEC